MTPAGLGNTTERNASGSSAVQGSGGFPLARAQRELRQRHHFGTEAPGVGESGPVSRRANSDRETQGAGPDPIPPVAALPGPALGEQAR